MILNTRIWKETVNAAKSAASTSPAWLRAIERAVIEIEKAKYWAFDGDVLTIISTTSRKTYRIDGNHTCEACANGHAACKHRAARRLMMRYTERLNAGASSPVPAPAPAPVPSRLTRRIERGHNGHKIVAVYCDGWAV
jgi:hypothetical protein